ncbi:SANT/Myb domain protein [Kalmanozyma brasiliensis GHG001]|uniref:Myb-like domain-containing protein n=1 Tax=Kalmanozyma brasiliensis (strain GHG001) TaxID=1365824 RepID=V5ESX4_KALBG|nr:SANT/Myb domain protein [Kalmanozyma brasiliensis GHG001]EST06078.1 SANT/Myb domain protein [Kalmanozyma brasiliensis GHG001]
MVAPTAAQPVAAVKPQKKDKKNNNVAVEGAAADAADADAVAEALDGAAAGLTDRKREKKDRKEAERLEREQAEKDAATVAAASAAQAVSAVASATRLPIDPSLDGSIAVAETTALAPAVAAPEQTAVAQPTQAAVNATAPAVGTSAGVDPITGEPIKRKRGRPKKDPNAPSVPKKPKRDAGEGGERRGRRAKMSEEAAMEELKGLSQRELLVERVYSSDMLAKLERTIGLKYQKGRFTKEEQDTIKNGIAEFMKTKGLSEDDFQELLYNYREKGWEKMYTELWKDLAGRLEGRPNIAVRLHVRTNKSQFRRQGRYTLAEDFEIRQRMGVMREDAASVAKRLGRLNQDVLSRFVKLQVKDEMADGPTWTADEDKAVLAALEQYKQEHPGEVISWKAIANMMGNKRSYKVYSNLFSNIRSRVDRSGTNPRRDYGTVGEDGDADASQQAVRGIQRHPTRAELDNSVWIPGEDDLILLQRLNFQDSISEASVRWADLSFESWSWPEETLKQQFAQIKSRYLPEGWSGGWQESLDKIIRTIRTRRTKKEIDDEGEDQRASGDAQAEAGVEAETSAAGAAAAAAAPVAAAVPEPAAADIDPALATDVSLEPASATV